jgi:hypothetical protein
MTPEIPDDAPANDDGMDVFDELAELPSVAQRWTAVQTTLNNLNSLSSTLGATFRALQG